MCGWREWGEKQGENDTHREGLFARLEGGQTWGEIKKKP
jgi:hypothetical protein